MLRAGIQRGGRGSRCGHRDECTNVVGVRFARSAIGILRHATCTPLVEARCAGGEEFGPGALPLSEATTLLAKSCQRRSLQDRRDGLVGIACERSEPP